MELFIDEKVADFFVAVHAEWYECVALLPMPQCQRKLDFVGVEVGGVRVGFQCGGFGVESLDFEMNRAKNFGVAVGDLIDGVVVVRGGAWRYHYFAAADDGLVIVGEAGGAACAADVVK